MNYLVDEKGCSPGKVLNIGIDQVLGNMHKANHVEISQISMVLS